jgi:hypothetical protein
MRRHGKKGMEWQDKVAIANYGLTALVMFFGFIAAARVYPGVHGDARRLVRGLAMVSLGWCLHQTYWFSRWWFKADGQHEVTQWFLDNAWTLTAIYWFLIHFGAIMVAYALYRDNCLIQNAWGKVQQMQFISGLWIWVCGLMAAWLIIFQLIP